MPRFLGINTYSVLVLAAVNGPAAKTITNTMPEDDPSINNYYG
tara:strand:- start:3131 stop:3259 length:129 start_codon:yes stop_codon:yes gene_type:complete